MWLPTPLIKSGGSGLERSKHFFTWIRILIRILWVGLMMKMVLADAQILPSANQCCGSGSKLDPFQQLCGSVFRIRIRRVKNRIN